MLKTMLNAELDTALRRCLDPRLVSVADGEHDNCRHLDALALHARAGSMSESVSVRMGRTTPSTATGWGGLLAMACLLAHAHATFAQIQHYLPLVMSASNKSQQGFVRVINRSSRAGTVRIHAIDDTGQRFGPVSLSLDSKETAHFSSHDLERGNASKGLFGGVGDGSGSWRLELDTNLNIEPLAYTRNADGYLTGMHDAAATEDVAATVAATEPATERILMRYRVPFFNPGSNYGQRSWLRLVNLSDRAAEVVIDGLDDRGDSPPDGDVRLTLPPGGARMVSAQELEQGGDDISGSFGDGTGKWQLSVSASTPIQVMSLLQSRMANLTSLPGSSSASVRERSSVPAPISENSIVSNDWDFIRSEDLGAFACIRYDGVSRAEMPDRRGGELFVDGVFVFSAEYTDGTSVGIWVHPDVGSRSNARELALQVAEPVGELPTIMRSRLDHVVVHRGNETAFAEDKGRFFVLYSTNMATRIRNHDLEETVFHESVHATLDQPWKESARWNNAQRADGGFITRYAERRPQGEDLAESSLFAWSLLIHPGRLPERVERMVWQIMPNRVLFFEELFVESGPVFQSVGPAGSC